MASVAVSQTAIQPRQGVVTLFGYGISVRVDHGHLIVEDGIGADRRQARFSRVGHGLRRLVVIGSDGMVSFAALNWLAIQKASFIMLERDGTVLLTTGPVSSSEAKLKRAQGLAHTSDVALRISRELIRLKLVGQERVARANLSNPIVADKIAKFRNQLATADSLASVRLIESQAAAGYFFAWHGLPINFPRNDLRLGRVPQHWRSFNVRTSSLTTSPRLATDPVNAVLNYCYAILESEARLALAALGLDPALGVLHVDTTARDSLACDLQEAVRPDVDAWVLTWFTRQTLKRDWFFEQQNGNARLMSSLAIKLSETALTWRRAVAPVAEWIAREFWLTIRKPDRPLATRLTQRQKREAKGQPSVASVKAAPQPEKVCVVCGTPVSRHRKHCSKCEVDTTRERIVDISKVGRVASHAPGSEARRAETQRRHAKELSAWKPSSLPKWLTEEVYARKVQPLLAGISNPVIMVALDISVGYSVAIRVARAKPHPRHWMKLAQLVGLVSEEPREKDPI